MSLEVAPEGTWKVYLDQVSEILARHFAGRQRVEVLEAGCGSASYVHFPSGAHVVGIDISPEQLERNTLVHERILGDLETYRHRPERFDGIVCWDVLEHLKDPAAAIDHLVDALRPGGLLVLGFPNRRSLKGQLTRVLPFRVHLWFYRYVLGSRTAGTKDHGPFPTPMRPQMSREALVARMRGRGFSVLRDVIYESPMMEAVRRRVGLHGAAWSLFRRAVRTVSRGSIEVDTTDCILVLEKPPSS